MSWNINGVKANDIWLTKPESPQFPLYENYKSQKIKTYQGLDGSPATTPYETRVEKILEQIVKLLSESNPDVLMLQEIDVNLSPAETYALLMYTFQEPLILKMKLLRGLNLTPMQNN